MGKFRLVAPCIFGLEKTLAFEIRKAGGENLSVTDGRIYFDGGYSVIANCNIRCGVAERIGIVLAEGAARDFDDIFNRVGNAPIEEFAAKNDKLHVLSGHSVNSKLSSVPAVQKTIKKALVERMKRVFGLAALEETGNELRISFLIIKDKFTLILDTSGDSLHKRGYRAQSSNAAPIRETLAAGIVDIARVGMGDEIFDPFCGSGTILIESVFKALGIAPGLNRSFSAMRWSSFPRSVWIDAYDSARADIVKAPDFTVHGYDIDEGAVRLTLENARKAGVAANVRAACQPVSAFSPPDNAKIICNPPYAERLLDAERARAVYRDMAAAFLPANGKRIFVICANEDFERCFGSAVKNRKLSNGMIKSRLYMY